LWAPDKADAHEWMAIKAPLLLAVPLVLFWAIQEEQKPLMPHKIRGLVMTIISEAAGSDKASEDRELVLSWCILTSQQNVNGNSLL
jgi:hypothetical protein